jgi:hypothetical protein
MTRTETQHPPHEKCRSNPNQNPNMEFRDLKGYTVSENACRGDGNDVSTREKKIKRYLIVDS